MIYINRNGDILAYFSSFSLLFLFLCKLNNVHILLTTPASIVPSLISRPIFYTIHNYFNSTTKRMIIHWYQCVISQFIILEQFKTCILNNLLRTTFCRSQSQPPNLPIESLLHEKNEEIIQIFRKLWV